MPVFKATILPNHSGNVVVSGIQPSDQEITIFALGRKYWILNGTRGGCIFPDRKSFEKGLEHLVKDSKMYPLKIPYQFKHEISHTTTCLIRGWLPPDLAHFANRNRLSVYALIDYEHNDRRYQATQLIWEPQEY